MAKELNAKNFKKEVLESELPAMVYFWASWCGPCKTMSPIADELADALKDKVKIVKVNIDEEDLVQKYSVMSVPTFLFFKKGKVVEQAGGVMTKDALGKIIKKAIK